MGGVSDHGRHITLLILTRVTKIPSRCNQTPIDSGQSMNITTIARSSVILLVFVLNTAWAQSFEDGMDAINKGDYETAFEIMQPLAEVGHTRAQVVLGGMYAAGKPVPEDDSEAVRWYRAAAERGHAGGQLILGHSYYAGNGVPQDYSEAMRWFRAAAEQGVARAQFQLGKMYGGGQGVIQDHVTAHMWLNIASANGNERAKEGMDVFADVMSREALEEAQSRARTCMESDYQDCD